MTVPPSTSPGSSEHTANPSGTESEFRWRAALVLFGVLFVGVSDAQMIPPLLPSIAGDMGTSAGRAAAIVTTYALAAAAFALLAGTASDRLGRKRLICMALALFSAASLLTAWSPYLSILLLTRLLTGFAAGTLSTLALSYAGDLFSYEQRGRAMGIISMAYFLAFVIGIPTGTYVTARVGWRWVFVGLAGASVLMLAVTARFLPLDRKRPAPIAFRMLTAHFRVRERVAGIVAAFLTSGGLVGFLTYVGAWMAAQNIGVERIGLLFMVAGVAATAASPVSGWLSDHFGKKRVIVLANLALAGLFVVVAGMEWGGLLFVAIGLLSVTASARLAPLHALTTELVGPEARGSYVAVRNAGSQLGIASMAALSAFAFDSAGFGAVAWIAAVATLLIVPVCAWIREPGQS